MKFKSAVPKLVFLQRRGSFLLFFHKTKKLRAFCLITTLVWALFVPSAVAQFSTNTPIFQFAIFYNVNMEIDPGAPMAVNGPVFSNAGLWSGTPNITYNSTVAAVGQVNTTATDPFATGKTDSGTPAGNFTLLGQPVSGASPIPLSFFGTNNLKAMLNLPPAPYDMGTANAYSTNGQAYLANAVDLYITNSVKGTNFGSLTPRGTNTIIYFQDSLAASPLTWITNDFYLLTNRITHTIFSTNNVTSNQRTNVWYAGYSFVTNAVFRDWREGRNGGSGPAKKVEAVQIDIVKFKIWRTNSAVNGGNLYNAQNIVHKGHPIDSIYVYNSVPLTGTTLPAVRLVKGGQLPSSDGFTLATPFPLYVYGNYNVSNNLGSSLGQNSTTYTWPAALMADAVTILSINWSDAITAKLPSSGNTTVNAAMLTGIVQSDPAISGDYSGGVENFLRLLEDWSGITLTYNGSIVALFPSQYATNRWKQGGNYYVVPTRHWAFDTNFIQVSKLPPLTPCVLNNNTNPPVIVTQPTNQTVTSGYNAIFGVTANGSGLLSYQWNFNGTNLNGAANASLTLTNVQFNQAGNYTVLVTNAYGSVLSSNAVLTVTATSPTIQAQPTNRTVFVNGTATFNVTATGSLPLSYQWNFNGTNIDGATNASLTLVNVQTNQAGNYAVQVINAFNSILSSNAALTVITLPPTILTQPTNQTVFVYSNATFSVTASGSSPLSYQWGFNGTNIDGATNITLTLTNVQPAQAGNYSVQVMNPFGSTNSANATLVVVAQPTILVQPVNQTLMAGNAAVFSVTAIGFSPLNYQWLFNGTNLAGNTNSLLTLAGANTNDNGSYQVIVTNSYGSVTSAIATLTLTRSLVVVWGNQTNVPDGLANVTAIAAGSDHNMALEANGTVAAWGGDTFGQTDVPADLTNVVTISAGVSDSLALQSNGKVIGWGFDSGGQINIPQNLTNVVAIAAGGFHSLALRADGTVAAWGEDYYGQTDVPGGLTNVVAIAAGGFHGLALQANGTVVAWGHYGYGIADVPAGLTNVVAIAGGNFHSLALRANGTVAAWGLDESGQTDVPLGLTNVVAITAGAYFSLALQANGTMVGWGYDVNGDTQAPAGLTNVIAIAAGNSHSMALENDGSPVVLRQPKSQTALTGTTITFTAAVVGRSQLSYQWQKNGTNLTDGGNVSGTTTATLTLASAQTNDAGIYALIVTNDFGSITSSNAVLTVLVPPSITTQPTSCTNVVGMVASFSVVADGTAPLNYQWQFNGTNLNYATNATLTLENVTLDQAGSYFVTVANLAGSVTSSNAVLSVYATAAATLGDYLFSSDNGFQFQVAGVPGFNYAVQESTNLIDWVSLITNTAPFSFTDTNATNSLQQFYRAIYLP